MGNDNTIRTRLNRISSCLGDKTDKKDIIWVSLLYMAGVAIHYLTGSFTKSIGVLADELLYYTMAQSIHNGSGIMCLNAHVGFNKLMYPLVLSPLFGIDDPVARVSMITLFNSALIMSSLFWAYLIGKELELNRGSMILAMLITLLFPDLMYSNSFMSENLNFPLVLLAVYVWLKSKRSGKRPVYSALLGGLCYIGYLGKNTFLAFFLSYVLFELSYPLFMCFVYRKDAPDKRIREYYDRNALIGCGAAAIVFAACYALGDLLLFGGGDANAAGAVSIGHKIFNDPYAFFYMLYAFVYYLAAALIAVLALPIAYPAAGFKRMERGTRDIFSFLILYLIISCAMVAYTIGAKEDIGASLPRVHLRYIGSILLLLIIVFLRFLQNDTDKTASGKQSAAAVLTTASACAVMKGFNYEAVDQSALNIYLLVSNALPPLTYAKNDLAFYPASAAVFLILALLAFIVSYYKKRSAAKASCVFAAFMLAVCFQNNRLEIEEYKDDYYTDAKIISNITAANDYLDEADGQKRILYIAGDNRSDLSKALITYFDHTKDICHSNANDVCVMAGGNGIIDVPNAEFETVFNSLTYTYDKFGGFDYIITDRGSNIELKGVTPIDRASGEFYTLYKNDDPAAIEIAPQQTA